MPIVNRKKGSYTNQPPENEGIRVIIARENRRVKKPSHCTAFHFFQIP